MRITIATGPMFPVPAVRGGAVPRMWQGLAGEFARCGHDACVFARAYPGQAQSETANGVRFIRWGGFEQSVSRLRDLLKDLVYGFRSAQRLPASDILITNDFWLPVFAVRRSACGRVVINANRFPKGQYRLYRRASRIAAASTAVRNEIVRQCPVLENRIRVFANPIDTQVLFPATVPRIVSRGKTLLFVGRLHPEKGVHVLISAFARVSSKHPTWRLILIGPVAQRDGGGGFDYVRELRKMASTAPVEFCDPVFNLSILADRYRDADLFCYPTLASKGEALPVAPMEAMACGVPALVSDLECFHDYITDKVSGFVFPHDSNDVVGELAVKLDALMSEPDILAAAGHKAAAIADSFSYPAVANLYLRDFSSLL